MTFSIDKDIPAPGSKGSDARARYPFRDMDVGDSITVRDADGFNAARKASEAATMYGRRNGKVFTCRTIEEGTVRIWRIK